MNFLTIYTLLPLTSAILFLLLGLFVYLNNRKSIINITFFLLCFVTFWWQFSWFILFNTQNETLASYLVKIGYMGIIFIPIFFFHFFISFLKEVVKKIDKYLLYLSYFLAIVFEFFLINTNLFISGFYQYFWGFYPKAGILHPLYLFLLTILAVRGLYLLISSIKRKVFTGYKHLQVKYLLLALIIYISAASDFLANYGVEFYPLGPIFVLGFLGISALAILKYHLFEIRVILTEILVAAMGIVLVILPFVMPTGSLRVLTLAVFLLFCVFAYYLIKATHEGTKRREEAERLTVQERVLRDEAERIAIQERALRQRSEKLVREFERLDRAKTQFLLATQHHLRTPLSIMKNYASMLLEGTYGKLGEIVKHPLSGIYVSIERLIKVVNEFLDVAQLQLGKGVLKKAKTDMINYLKKEIIEELLPSAKEKGLYLKLEPSKEKIPEIMIDQTKMKTAIYNVVDNGLKYTQKGGVTIKLQIVNGKLQIVVKDTGIGIKKEEIAELFERTFERGKEAEKLYTTGRGIGLYISKNFIEAHQGKIWAESEGEGKGSTFYIELPRT